MTEAIKYISRFNSESPLPGVLELYAQSFLSSALRELFGMGILKVADGWLWWSGSIQVALMPLTTPTPTTHNNTTSPTTSSSSSTPSTTREPSTLEEDIHMPTSIRSRAVAGVKGVGGTLGRLLLAFLRYSDVVISKGATTFRDEVVGVTWLLIERSHLQTYSSSMAENFFGMKRAGVVRIGNDISGRGTSSGAVPSSLRKALSFIGGSPSSGTGDPVNTVDISTIVPPQQQVQVHDCNRVFGSLTDR